MEQHPRTGQHPFAKADLAELGRDPAERITHARTEQYREQHGATADAAFRHRRQHHHPAQPGTPGVDVEPATTGTLPIDGQQHRDKSATAKPDSKQLGSEQDVDDDA